MEPILVGDLLEELNELNSDGFRVLAVANKKVEKRAAYSKADEDGLVLTGYLAFLDPPKETAAKAISGLNQHGVTVKVLTGDNDLVTRKICTEVGLNAEKILLGSAVEKMSDLRVIRVSGGGKRFCATLAGAQAANRKGASGKRPHRGIHG